MRKYSLGKYLKLLRERFGESRDSGDSEYAPRRPKRKRSRTRLKTVSQYQLLSAIARRQKSNQVKADSEHLSYERTTSGATSAIAWLTGVLAFVGLGSAIFSGLQWVAIKGQLDAMEADQRPWISVSPTIDGPVDIGENQTGFNIGFDVNNVGKSPAFNVQIWVDIQPISVVKRVKIEPSAFCFLPKMTKFVWPGRWVPPGDVYHRHRETTIISNSLISEAAKDDPDGRFWAVVVGCVLYQIEGKDDVKETPILFRIYRWLPEHPSGMTSFKFAPNTNFPQETLRLDNDFFHPDHQPD